jgi:MSHA pilin protein MshD
MLEAGARVRKIILEETMLSRLAQSEQMREFFIQMWMQNPGLAKQGGVKVQDLIAKLGDDAPPVFPQQPPIMERTKQRGISLVELIMFIVIVSVALAGILLVMNVTTRGSVDPLIHKQALAIGGAEGRYAAPQFDNVSDYNGCQMNTGIMNSCDSTGNVGIRDITNTAAGSAGYKATIAVVNNGMPAAGGSLAIANNEALLITVTVTGSDNVPVVVEGMRTRYSPRAVP